MERLAAPYQEAADLARHGIEAGPARSTPLAEFHADHRAAWTPGKAPKSVEAFDRAWAIFLAFCKGRGLSVVQAIGTAECRAFLAARRSVAAHSTVKQERGLIAPAWESAVRDGAIPSNPWRVERVPGKPREERPDYWEPAELARLLAACRPWEREVATLGANTGLRADNLLSLEWAEVRLDAGRIEIPASKMKSGRPLSLPLAPAARAVLERAAGRPPGRFVFRKPDGSEGPPTIKDLWSRMAAARKRAGLPPKRRAVHILRHTFATHAARTVPLPVLRQWLGHSSIAQTMRYVQVADGESGRHMATFSFPTADDGPSAGGTASDVP